MNRQIEEPRRIEVAAARRRANRTGARLIDAGCAGQPMTQGEVEAVNAAGYTPPVLKRCRACADPLLDDRFAYCPKCDRDAKGPFSFGESDE